uniref:Uncharacterized protein n=1 Tax=Paramormyrops kingsleyae TaxID=1676925 RepID=A0A3B3QJN8_9TELE
MRSCMKFGDQDYKTLRSRCLQQGKLFEDDLFPAGSWALGYQELGPTWSLSCDRIISQCETKTV